MSRYKISFTLRQHTPMIHFQHDQPGATLRATELKPKLDKFLLEKEPKLPKRKHPNNHESLNYKVKTTPDLSASKEIPEKHRLFFANMGDNENPKRYKKSDKPLKIEFFSFEPKLIEAIDRHFRAFLASHNFGTRQSKGFGSFYLDGEEFDSSLIESKVYHFTASNGIDPKSKMYKYENDIATFYAFLRSGMNFPNGNERTRFYTKSAIFAYAKSKGITWDKKAIKTHYFNDKVREQKRKHPDSEALNYQGQTERLMRDMLGLSSSQEWRSYRATITKEHEGVKRFRSPITFKPIVRDEKYVDVYFWASHSVDPMRNKSFHIKVNNHGDLTLPTPNNDEFDLDEFLEFAIDIQLDRFIDAQFHDQPEYATLHRILEEIRSAR